MKTDVLIIGGGLSGLTLAGVLGNAGVDVCVIDRDPPVSQLTEKYDARATAVSFATKKILECAGAWQALESHAEPLLDIRVADGESPLFLHFDARHSKGQPFGWNVENVVLRKTLYDNIKRLKKNVHHLAPATIKEFTRQGAEVGVVLKDGQRIAAPLMLGADGRNSAVRDWLGIDVKAVDYKQSAIVCTIAHARDHENVAVEHFLPAGPFAVLPLTKGRDGKFRSSVIWTVEGKDADSVLSLSSADFDAAVQDLCGEHLGRVRCVSQPRAYPLSMMHAKRYVGERAALLAEAAHVIHPIAGQGLNVSMGDVALLAELVVDHLRLGLDIGAPALLERYETLRYADARRMILFTSGLNGLCSNTWKSAAFARHLGLGIVQKISPLKGFFASQAMGLGGKPSRIVRTGRIVQ